MKQSIERGEYCGLMLSWCCSCVKWSRDLTCEWPNKDTTREEGGKSAKGCVTRRFKSEYNWISALIDVRLLLAARKAEKLFDIAHSAAAWT